MIRLKTSRLTVAVAVAAALIVVMGGLATASNMGMKLNKVLVDFFPTTGVPTRGINWVALPYNNPYGTFNGLCTQAGLRSAPPRARIIVVNQATNEKPTFDCGLAGSNVALPIDGRGIEIRQIAPVPSPFILVGSHNSGRLIDIPYFCNTRDPAIPRCAGAGIPLTGQGQFRFAVPYHTTAVTFADLCTSMDLSRTPAGRARLIHMLPASNTPETADCGLAAANGRNIVLGEAIEIREVNNRTGIRPAHF